MESEREGDMRERERQRERERDRKRERERDIEREWVRRICQRLNNVGDFTSSVHCSVGLTDTDGRT